MFKLAEHHFAAVSLKLICHKSVTYWTLQDSRRSSTWKQKPGFDLWRGAVLGISPKYAQNADLGVASSLKCLIIYMIATSDTYLHHLEYAYGIIYKMGFCMSKL